MKSRFNFKIWTLTAAILVPVIYLVLSPLNTPLYDLIMFPCPDPRILNLDKEFAALQKAGIKKKDITLVSTNGQHLQAWFLELPGTKRVFLYSHSKGNNIYGKIHVAESLLTCGGSVFMYDYQGYGQSEGRATLQNCCDDGVAAYDYLTREEHRQPRDIIGFGESLGSGVTGQLAAKRSLSGVIFQSGFASIKAAAVDSLFWLKFYPNWLFPKQMMNNVAVFTKPHPPLLMSHGKKDTVVQYANAMELYEKTIPIKTLITFDAGGHGTVGAKGEFYAAVRKFIKDNDL